MTDWDRSQPVDALPPTPAVVFLELTIGVVGAALVDAFVLASMGIVAAVAAALLGSSMGGGGLGDALVGVAAVVGGFTLFAIGVAQWAWLLPLIAALFRRRRALALGLAIGGVVVAMLNGTCWATIAAS